MKLACAPRHACPVCGASSARSRYRHAEYVLAAVCLAPYRCMSCQHRFWHPSQRAVRKILTLLALLLLGSLVAWSLLSFLDRPAPPDGM